MQCSSTIIVRAFENTRLHPILPPPEVDDGVGAASLTDSMQCSEGKKILGLSSISKKILGLQPFMIITTSVPKEIVDASKHNSRNILVRSIACDVINRTLLTPFRETKRITQEYTPDNSTKIGSIAIPLHERRTNPDST